MGTIKNLLDNVSAVQYNASSIQSAILSQLDDVQNGTATVVDPSNPFVLALESASVLTAAAMIKNEANTRKQYAVLAQTYDDLYRHMSDVDYLNRFAVPSKTTVSMLLDLNEILANAVLDTATGIKKIVIPRNTVFNIAGVNFSIQYPIEIRQLAHGGIQLIYDTTKLSPLQQLSTNVVYSEIRNISQVKYIYFEFEVFQFDIITQTGSLNAISDFSIDTTITDQFYFARVFVDDGNGNWTEIRTTHSDLVYDPTLPTAVVKVVGQNVNVSIPQVYTGTGLLNNGIRVDIYQTKGSLDMILADLPFSSYTADWKAIDPADSNMFTAPINALKNVTIFSNSVVAGGSNGITFDELRTQVINNSTGSKSAPITPAQIASALEVNGYRIVNNVDNITNRIFLATKGMPTPVDKNLITPAASGIATINSTIKDLVQLSTVIDNGSSITITPDTIYKRLNGVVKPLTTEQLHTLLNQQANALATDVSNNEYLYTPFHYVMDLVNNELNVRPYYLDGPSVVTKQFVSQNDTTGLQVSVGNYVVVRTATGYKLTITTQSSDAFKAILDATINVQLSFIPEGEITRAYLNGVFVGSTSAGERIYTFDLSTNFNVDSNDMIKLTKFLMFTTQPRLSGAALTTDFDIIFTTNSQMPQQWVSSDIDKKLGDFLLPQGAVGISNEKIRIEFGKALPTLWARARSIASSLTYQRYTTDVPLLYENDVYAKDALGSIIAFTGNTPVYNILHHRGDPVLDGNGNQVYVHRAGDIVYDAITGYPVVAEIRDILRQFDIMLIEGTYWFANDTSGSNYRSLIIQNLIGWLTTDLVDLRKQALERTDIYFYPDGSLGDVSAMVNNGLIANISASQSFTVELTVPASVYNDVTLKDQLTLATINEIKNQLANVTVTVDNIITALKAIYGSDVITVSLTGLGGSNNYTVVTMMDNSKRCSIKKKLTALPNGSLIVEEDINVNFIPYKLPS